MSKNGEIEENSEEVDEEEQEEDFQSLKDFDEDIENLKQITDIYSCTGNEHAVRHYIRQQIEPLVDEIKTDSIGNIIGIVKGKEGHKTIMLDAHMDEIGFLVSHIDKNGFLRVVSVGGQNVRILPGSRVIVHSYTGTNLEGVFGEKAIHLLSKKERAQGVDLEKLFIDLGFKNEEEVKKHVRLGDYVTLHAELKRYHGTDRVAGKAIDDRAGCFMIIETLKRLKELPTPIGPTIVACFSVQEEIGVRGATVAAYTHNPDLALVLEVTHAIDFPGSSKDKEGETVLGKGPEITLGPNLHPTLSKQLIDLAHENEIPIQLGTHPRLTGTNARIIQVTREGIPVALISIPLRYMHTTVETIDMNDLEYTIRLILAFLQTDLSKSYILN